MGSNRSMRKSETPSIRPRPGNSLQNRTAKQMSRALARQQQVDQKVGDAQHEAAAGEQPAGRLGQKAIRPHLLVRGSSRWMRESETPSIRPRPGTACRAE